MVEKHKQSLKLVEKKAEELAQKLKTSEEETQEHMQAAADENQILKLLQCMKMVAKYKQSAKHAEERVKKLELGTNDKWLEELGCKQNDVEHHEAPRSARMQLVPSTHMMVVMTTTDNILLLLWLNVVCCLAEL